MTTDTHEDEILRKKDGVSVFGLYVDFIIYDPTTGSLQRQERRFLVNNYLFTYSRPNGDKRASWRPYSFDDHDQARSALIKNLSRYKHGVQLTADPFLVEMTTTDIESLLRGEAPYGRHSGTVATEKATGKINDKTWLAHGAAAGSPF